MHKECYTRIHNYLDAIPQYPMRSDCPICGGKNSFSADIVDGVILFFCYRASCSIRGKKDYEISVSSIRNTGSVLGPVTKNTSPRLFTIPDYFTNALQHKSSYRFLDTWGLIDAYIHKQFLAYYDPKLERCVFILQNEKGEIKGATGRALNRSYPKWYIYDRINSCPFLCKPCNAEPNFAFLVEDCVSAVRVSSICTGVSILGTNLAWECVPYLRQYDLVYICLDDDATGKSLKLQERLKPFVDTRIIPLRTDLKYLKQEEIMDLIK